eukprot:gene1800-2361_t
MRYDGGARRCGWFDAALLRRSVQINGVSGMCITKLDVMDGLETIKICTSYTLDGRTVDIFPVGAEDAARCQPIYEEMAGWSESTVGAKSLAALPANAPALRDGLHHARSPFRQGNHRRQGMCHRLRSQNRPGSFRHL